MTEEQLNALSDMLENTIYHLAVILDGMKDLNKILEEGLKDEPR